MKENICPKAVDDISWWVLCKKNGKNYYSLGSKKLDTYIRCDENNLSVIVEVINLLDGENSIEWIEDFFMDDKKIKIDIYHLYSILSEAGLIEGVTHNKKNSEISIMGVDLINIKFKELPKKCLKIVGVAWNICFLISLIICIAAFAEILHKFNHFVFVIQQSFIFDNSYVLGGILVAIASIIGLITHEMAHWFTAVKFGLQPSEFHLTMYTGVLPTWYVKINGMYTLPVTKRIAVTAAGMFANFVFICLIIFISLKGNYDLLQIQIFSKIIYSFFFNIIFSLLPINLTDGYFIFSWIVGVSNLRIRILNDLKKMFHGKKPQLDKTEIGYFTLCITLLLFSIYNGIRWNVEVLREVWCFEQLHFFRYIVSVFVVVFYSMTFYRFSNRFIKYLKSSY